MLGKSLLCPGKILAYNTGVSPVTFTVSKGPNVKDLPFLGGAWALELNPSALDMHVVNRKSRKLREVKFFTLHILHCVK